MTLASSCLRECPAHCGARDFASTFVQSRRPVSRKLPRRLAEGICLGVVPVIGSACVPKLLRSFCRLCLIPDVQSRPASRLAWLTDAHEKGTSHRIGVRLGANCRHRAAACRQPGPAANGVALHAFAALPHQVREVVSATSWRGVKSGRTWSCRTAARRSTACSPEIVTSGFHSGFASRAAASCSGVGGR